METYLNHYLDLGLIADYYRYHDKKIPTGLSEFSSKLRSEYYKVRPHLHL